MKASPRFIWRSVGRMKPFQVFAAGHTGAHTELATEGVGHFHFADARLCLDKHVPHGLRRAGSPLFGRCNGAAPCPEPQPVPVDQQCGFRWSPGSVGPPIAHMERVSTGAAHVENGRPKPPRSGWFRKGVGCFREKMTTIRLQFRTVVFSIAGFWAGSSR